MTKRTIIACNILEEEMKYVLDKHPEYEVDVVWIRAGLHNDMNILQKRLDEIFAETPPGDEKVRLLIGFGCLPDLKSMAQERGYPLLSTKNCLGAIVGEERLAELEKNNTMVITPQWIRKTWFAGDGMREMLGWDDTDFRINFGRYDRILVLDMGLCPLTDEETLEAFSIIEVPIETESFPMEHFEKFFLEFLN
ncbi:MAG: DUF1638 domain-containing protein [Deltaproteobacteria bacterium]|jgi:hypothetical protein|nr:DUF1638 domain-containing protein [Deltaproteobacteria bacterium]